MTDRHRGARIDTWLADPAGLAAGLSCRLGGVLVAKVGPRVVLVGAGAGGLLTALALSIAVAILSRSGSPTAPSRGPG